MDKDVRNRIQRATQSARAVLVREYAEQLEGLYDVHEDGSIAGEPGVHLDEHGRLVREKLVAAIGYRTSGGSTAAESVAEYLREASFTSLNRFVALKLLEARGLLQECVSNGDQSSGFREFSGLAPGLVQLADHGYRLYLESLFDEIAQEVGVLFDRRDPASMLWPRRQALLDLFAILNDPALREIWNEDETMGWVYQYFNSKDERELMRDVKRGGSQAPRNSHELAVRNQFFTPRYVVQFLVENTLGRLWVEMHGDRTGLPDRCEYLVHSTAEDAQVRTRKDPRDLRILDPACGSGHFLLYSFDLLLDIYEEAWNDQDFGVGSQATGRTLREDYPERSALRRAMPSLIVENNLHGVEIDSRCAQIAALVLWLRAQRAWTDCGVSPTERPSIRRTNVVVAEPMPGDIALVKEFGARLDPPLLGDLFTKMVGQMSLAGELGPLLRVEDSIASGLRSAREQYLEQQRTAAALPGLEPARRQGELNLSGIDDDRFFHEAESRIVEALRAFAERAGGPAGVRRRLFVEDAAQGVALIDLLRQRFDVVLMNPPFGAASLAAKKQFEKAYPRTKNDIYAAFVERGVELLHSGGMIGAITSRTGFFLSSFQRWREEILLREAPPVVFADLGYGVLDSAMVEVAAYCLEKGPRGRRLKTTFLRASEAGDKAAALCEAIREPDTMRRSVRFDADVTTFTAIPRSPFAYWVSNRLLQIFEELPTFEAEGRTAKQGLATADDFRFVRAWWAAPQGIGEEWFPFAKGGKFSPFYSDVFLALRWRADGHEMKAFAGSLYNNSHWSRILKNTTFFFRPGLTWPRRTQGGLSLRAMPEQSIFADKGPALFVQSNNSEELLSLLAVVNSRAFRALVDLQMAFGSYEVGVIQRTPIPPLGASKEPDLASLARRAWSLRRSLDAASESSHAFILPPLLQAVGHTLDTRADAWAARRRAVEAELAVIQADIDERCFDLYGIDDVDRSVITDGFGGVTAEEAVETDEAETDGDDAEAESPDGSDADGASLAATLVSWAVGVAFGRFDVRLATGERGQPEEPEPFDPLPVCSPGMLAGDDGSPIERAPDGYSIAFPDDGVMVDDPGDRRDLTTAVRTAFEVVFGPRSDEVWLEAATLLDPKGQDMRVWLASGFFEHHLKRHSGSRRKEPIVWQLGTPSGRYSVWLYAHRLTPDSFFQLQNDVVAPKLANEERRLMSLVQSAGGTPSVSERKAIAWHEACCEELRALLDEVKRVAPLWDLTLDDGVALTMAPLWRLVPQHKSWQKELKTRWDDLAAGKYDWSHLAMHLWPERVVPKCATDRSLAIAHELEDEFWVEGDDGKWNPRAVPTHSVEALVGKRTSSAVQAARQDLLEAPPAAWSSRPRARAA